MFKKILTVHFKALKFGWLISIIALGLSLALFLIADICDYSTNYSSASASLTFDIILLIAIFGTAICGIVFKIKALAFTPIILYLGYMFVSLVNNISIAQSVAFANEGVLTTYYVFRFFISICVGLFAFVIVASAFGLKINRFVAIGAYHPTLLFALINIILTIVFTAQNSGYPWYMILSSFGTLIFLESLPFVYHAFDQR